MLASFARLNDAPGTVTVPVNVGLAELAFDASAPNTAFCDGATVVTPSLMASATLASAFVVASVARSDRSRLSRSRSTGSVVRSGRTGGGQRDLSGRAPSAPGGPCGPGPCGPAGPAVRPGLPVRSVRRPVAPGATGRAVGSAGAGEADDTGEVVGQPAPAPPRGTISRGPARSVDDVVVLTIAWAPVPRSPICKR